MSRWLALAQKDGIKSLYPPDNLTEGDKSLLTIVNSEGAPLLSPFVSVSDEGRDKNTAPCMNAKDEAPLQPTTPPKDTFRHGKSPSGNPISWSGRIVSLADWRTMSEWDKHGPDGRHWNGITKQWELPK